MGEILISFERDDIDDFRATADSIKEEFQILESRLLSDGRTKPNNLRVGDFGSEYRDEYNSVSTFFNRTGDDIELTATEEEQESQ
ncbi:hypothetical protein [Nocardiopsis alborubida]|uniref:Uncharacterized protein n=1 Tax=Nocardiopsis alborubida TaxID=146802 RepID=A0A7X6RTF3_9ACTN|nr:hypothetical protein [Nocardiopsis alborubida]NKZ01664.1 hypothetical protein [Nocardiopsis alborubida]